MTVGTAAIAAGGASVTCTAGKCWLTVPVCITGAHASQPCSAAVWDDRG